MRSRQSSQDSARCLAFSNCSAITMTFGTKAARGNLPLFLYCINIGHKDFTKKYLQEHLSTICRDRRTYCIFIQKWIQNPTSTSVSMRLSVWVVCLFCVWVFCFVFFFFGGGGGGNLCKFYFFLNFPSRFCESCLTLNIFLLLHPVRNQEISKSIEMDRTTKLARKTQSKFIVSLG